MDKTIQYTEKLVQPPNVIVKGSIDTKETEDVLGKIEKEYGKDFKGGGFAMEKFEQNRMNNPSNK